MYKPIPIGIENFKEMIDKNYYYADKTLMIRDLLDNMSKVSLYTRPRRFGKTLNMSMLKYYFEKSDTDNSYIFDGLNISKCKGSYSEHMGRYPVISVTLKGMKRADFEQSFDAYKDLIKDEFSRHNYALDSEKLSLEEREDFIAIRSGKASNTDYYRSIEFLSNCLEKVHGEKVVILVDEYDVPLESAYFGDFYDDMVDLIRTAFEGAFKTNDSLNFGVLTGCLRISKESIFTGLNNLKVNSILSKNYAEYFGFTEVEVKDMADSYGVSERFGDIKRWYNGYLFGETEIYNPWSILNYIDDIKGGGKAFLQPYWSNTSSNSIIKQLISDGDSSVKETIEILLSGESITKPVYADITYRNIDVNTDYIWSFLMFTGYLKPINIMQETDMPINAEMVIPNIEVKTIYREHISIWLQEEVRSVGTSALFEAIVNGDVQTFENELNDWLLKSISYHDSRENFYHGFLMGILVGAQRYKVKSNRESGNGRSDITVCEFQRRSVAVVIELKVADNFTGLEGKCDEALKQIDARDYAADLVSDGYKKIVKYGVAFYRKSCMVKMG